MLSTRDILLSVLLPGALSLVVMLLAWRPWRGRREIDADEDRRPGSAELDYAPADRKTASGPFWASVLALGGVLLVAFPNILGRAPGFPPTDFTTTLFYVAIGVSILSLLDALAPLPRWARLLLALLLPAAAATAGFWRQIHGGFNAERAALLVGLIAVAGLVWWLSLDALARRGGNRVHAALNELSKRVIAPGRERPARLARVRVLKRVPMLIGERRRDAEVESGETDEKERGPGYDGPSRSGHRPKNTGAFDTKHMKHVKHMKG